MSAAKAGGADKPVAMTVKKPRALNFASTIVPFAPASPARGEAIAAGLSELERLGFRTEKAGNLSPEGFFAGSRAERSAEFLDGLRRRDVDGLVAVRGGYGSNYLLEGLEVPNPNEAKVILGFSDLTSLHIYLWQRWGWVTLYGPMVAAGLDGEADAPKGYDRKSLLEALQRKERGWSLALQGETLEAGEASGRLLGGCMTLVETTIGTPWELETHGAILLLEDRGMKPWQVDRALMHLKQAGKFEGVRGILLGDFPECEAPVAGSPTVREVCARILEPLGVPIVFGAPVGHTERSMLTIPLGVMGRLKAEVEGVLEILEPAVVA
jgi:muramoyltetrapeptide carboxypeptidase